MISTCNTRGVCQKYPPASELRVLAKSCKVISDGNHAEQTLDSKESPVQAEKQSLVLALLLKVEILQDIVSQEPVLSTGVARKTQQGQASLHMALPVSA